MCMASLSSTGRPGEDTGLQLSSGGISLALQRVYGITFPDKKALKEYQTRMEEAKKRDHRLLGTQHDLFMMHPLSPGSCFFMPHGARIYNQLMDVSGRHANWSVGPAKLNAARRPQESSQGLEASHKASVHGSDCCVAGKGAVGLSAGRSEAGRSCEAHSTCTTSSWT